MTTLDDLLTTEDTEFHEGEPEAEISIAPRLRVSVVGFDWVVVALDFQLPDYQFWQFWQSSIAGTFLSSRLVRRRAW
jgi:hypothetical protein